MAKGLPVENVGHTIELDEKINSHIRGWKVQRVGWMLMLLTILCALLGLCGNGPLSHRTQSINNDTLEYEYFLRYQGQAVISVTVQNQKGLTSIAFPSKYWESFQVERIIPEPAENRQVADSLYYFFRGDKKGLIRFFLKPQKRGSIDGSISINNQLYFLSHFIYP